MWCLALKKKETEDPSRPVLALGTSSPHLDMLHQRVAIHPLCLATVTVIENMPPSVTPLGGRWERMPGSLSQKRATAQRVASERQKLFRLTHSILSPREEHEMRDDCGLAESLHKLRSQGQPCLPGAHSSEWKADRKKPLQYGLTRELGRRQERLLYFLVRREVREALQETR